MQPDTENLRRAAERLERLDSLWRESLLKINELRTELGRAGFPVDEDAWPTEQLRALVDAYLSDGSSCGSIVRAAHDILNGSGIAHDGLVNRVTELRRRRDLLDIENNNLRDAHTKLIAQRADLSRRLDAVTLDRDSLVGKLDAMRGERDEARAERDNLRTEASILTANLASAHAELEARAPKAAAVEWFGRELRVNDSPVAAVRSSLERAGQWYVYRLKNPKCWATSQESAMRLAELLANHDPGGTWRVNGDIVSPDTVRLVCPSVAVTWGES